MPIMDGFDLCRKVLALYQHEPYSHYTPTMIGTTSYLDETTKDTARSVGYHHIFEVPLMQNFIEFISKITLDKFKE